MIYTIDYSKAAQKKIAKWKKFNPVLFGKLRKILNDIIVHPREGIGHPEPLKGGNDVTYSRHITGHDRIVYDIYDESIRILVLAVEGHYKDK